MADSAWITALAGHGLPGAPSLATPSSPITETLSAVARHKLTGVFAAAVVEGAIGLPPDDEAALASAHETAMREVLLLEEMLLDAIDVLVDAGVDSRVLKGTALAHMVHTDPAERCFGDNDVLVASAEVDRAVDALTRAGAVRPVPPLSADFDRRFAKSVTLRWSGDTELDLHRTLAAGPYGHMIVLEDLFRDPVEVILADRAVHTLPADLHLLHGAIHVALGDVDARLGNIRDVALLASWPSIDPDLVVETATRWGCRAPVAEGLRATRALGHERSPIERWADEFAISAADRRRLMAYGERRGRYRRQARASLAVMGWRDRVAFTRALLMPTAANRVARGRVRPTG